MLAAKLAPAVKQHIVACSAYGDEPSLNPADNNPSCVF